MCRVPEMPLHRDFGDPCSCQKEGNDYFGSAIFEKAAGGRILDFRHPRGRNLPGSRGIDIVLSLRSSLIPLCFHANGAAKV